MEDLTPKCYFCGHELHWQSDFNYDEVFLEGDGIVSEWTCPNCGAEAEYSKRYDDDDKA